VTEGVVTAQLGDETVFGAGGFRRADSAGRAARDSQPGTRICSWPRRSSVESGGLLPGRHHLSRRHSTNRLMSWLPGWERTPWQATQRAAWEALRTFP
jgi:hypothetical protein